MNQLIRIFERESTGLFLLKLLLWVNILVTFSQVGPYFLVVDSSTRELCNRVNLHLIWFLLRVFIIRDNISIVIYVVSHHFIRFDSLDDRLNVMFLFKYLRRMVQVIRYESFDIKGCLFWRGGSNWCGNDSFEPKIWFGLYQRTLTN